MIWGRGEEACARGSVKTKDKDKVGVNAYVATSRRVANAYVAMRPAQRFAGAPARNVFLLLEIHLDIRIDSCIRIGYPRDYAKVRRK